MLDNYKLDNTTYPRWFNVTFSSPNVGGHLTIWKGHVFTIPKRSQRIARWGYVFFFLNLDSHVGWYKLDNTMIIQPIYNTNTIYFYILIPISLVRLSDVCDVLPSMDSIPPEARREGDWDCPGILGTNPTNNRCQQRYPPGNRYILPLEFWVGDRSKI